MKEIISKQSIKQSIQLISEIELNEDDYSKIFKKFSEIFDSPEFSSVIEKINKKERMEGFENHTDLMDLILKHLTTEEIHLLLKRVMKNEDLIDFIQDLFLEKLI